MKNIMFVTLGTRDVVASAEIEHENELFVQLGLEGKIPKNNQFDLSPRAQGKIVLDKWEQFSQYIKYPIIQPVIQEILEMQVAQFDYVFLVHTDQSRSVDVSEVFVERDSIFFAQVIEKKLRTDFGNKIKEIKKIPVTKQVVHHDAMYKYFGEEIAKIFKKHSDANSVKAFILPQGGIAAVNNALLLRCIEYFDDLTQFSKSENTPIPARSSFPSLFKKNITKEKIKQAIDNFDYQIVPIYDYSDVVSKISEYASHRLSFNFVKARKCLYEYGDSYLRDEILALSEEAKFIEEDLNKVRAEWYIRCKIDLKKEKYSDFLLRIFNLAESILKPYAEEKLGGPIVYKQDGNHKEWTALISRQPTELKDYLNAYKVHSSSTLNLSSPGRFAYKAIFDFYESEEGRTYFDENIYFGLNRLTIFRNKVAHNLRGVSEEDIEKCLKEVNLDISKFVSNLDGYFEVEGFGSFESVNKILYDAIDRVI